MAVTKSNERTKYELADAMKRCMKTAPVEKITVKEIVEACGVTRQTFYRNFQDKYDLINWYFDKILLESFEHMGEGKSVYEGLVNKFTYIQEEKLFFKAAFKNDDQNCLRDHDFQLITAFYTDQIESRTGKKTVHKAFGLFGGIDIGVCAVAFFGQPLHHIAAVVANTETKYGYEYVILAFAGDEILYLFRRRCTDIEIAVRHHYHAVVAAFDEVFAGERVGGFESLLAGGVSGCLYLIESL